MPYYGPGLKAAVDGVAAAGTRITFFTADPGATAANEVSATGRPATTWGTESGGVRVGSQVSAPIPAGTTVTHWGIMSAATGTNILFSAALSAPETFGAAGNILHTPTISAIN